jgi:hypothetical protein
VRRTDGSIRPLDAPGADPQAGGTPTAMNVHGVITGTFTDGSGKEHGFVRQREK